MSIKLRFEKGSLAIQAVLKDEALASLLDLISKQQSDESPPPLTPSLSSQIDSPPLKHPASMGGEGEETVKGWLKQHSPSEILNLINWDTNPEKILLLGAYHESVTEEAKSWRSADMEIRFSEAKEPSPANFPRDISNAIKGGLIAPVTPRTYRVSRTGWTKIAAAITKNAQTV